MGLCPKCGSQMSYVNQYQQWYCYNCQGYRQPQSPPPQEHQQPPPPPPQAPAYQPRRPVQQQVQYQQPAVQPHQYPPPAQQQYGVPQYAIYGQEQKVGSSFYIAIVALIFAFLGGILGMILAIVAGWLAKKQAAQGLARTQEAMMIANIAFVIAMVVFIIIVTW